jgi:hypothetical protein
MPELSAPHGLEGDDRTHGTPGTPPLTVILRKFSVPLPIDPPAPSPTDPAPPIPAVVQPLSVVSCVPILAWDQVEADRFLATARAAVTHAEAEHRAGRITNVRLDACRTWQEVCEGYAADHESEARRGWDAMQLLRDASQRLAVAAGCTDPRFLPGTGS